MPTVGHFPIYLGLGVFGHGVCLHSLHSLALSDKKLESRSAGPNAIGLCTNIVSLLLKL